MPLNSPKRPPYWNSTFGFDHDHITAVDMSFCTSLRNFIQIGPPSAEKMTSCRFSRRHISAILNFMGPIMGSLKSPCTTSYRSSIETIAVNYLVFEKIAFLTFWRQTDRQTNKQMDSPNALSRSRCRERRLNNVTIQRHGEQLQLWSWNIHARRTTALGSCRSLRQAAAPCNGERGGIYCPGSIAKRKWS